MAELRDKMRIPTSKMFRVHFDSAIQLPREQLIVYKLMMVQHINEYLGIKDDIPVEAKKTAKDLLLALGQSQAEMEKLHKLVLKHLKASGFKFKKKKNKS